MNWGHKITIVIILFIIGMLSMVYVASKQTNEMFDKDYYEKELKYQNYIEAAKNLQSLKDTISITQLMDSLLVTLPTLAATNIEEGNIELLKADDSKKDVKQKFIPHQSKQFVLKQKLVAGVYNARIYWSNNKTPYYKEQQISITK